MEKIKKTFYEQIAEIRDVTHLRRNPYGPPNKVLRRNAGIEYALRTTGFQFATK